MASASASLAALNAALLGGGAPTLKSKSKGKGKGKGKMNKGKDKKKLKTVSSAPDMMQVLAATVKTVDGQTASITKQEERLAKMEMTMNSLQQVVVQLGKRSLEASAGGGQTKKRKVPEHIVNYYLVATEFFNHFSTLTGVEQKKTLGKSGIDAWGKNKDELTAWFKENGLDLEASKLKIADIRTIISDQDLYSKFKTDFDELCTAIETAEPLPKPEADESDDESDDDDSDDNEQDADDQGDEDDDDDNDSDNDNDSDDE